VVGGGLLDRLAQKNCGMDYHVAHAPETAFEKHEETCAQCGSHSAQLCPVGEELFEQSLAAQF